MKYSNYIGSAAALTLMVSCFFPWVYITEINQVLTGVDTGTTNFGKPGMMHLVMSVAAIVCFFIPRIGAKRANLFICAFNVAWAFRNLILMSACEAGVCPDRKAGLYVAVSAAVVMMLMALFPKMKVQ